MMQMDQGTAAVLVAAISLLGTGLGLLFNSKLEHRLTVIEERKADRGDFEALAKKVDKNASLTFSEADKNCLREINLKMGFLWSFYQGEAAKALKNPALLDAVFTRLSEKESTILKEYEGLDAENRFNLIKYLEDTMNGGEPSQKKEITPTLTPIEAARLLLGMLKIEREIINDCVA